ncbi:DNA helicase [Bacillus phage SP-15]|uniref:DNA helicase n=1 Tax=Bacillus phage SP-15 TaxID=1792032 RepID=A0A127AWM7_9CAUD|nr:DNA helicase [Bacillus phage SP-15]AMM44992.1 DNA helicase [Bacillus phage SP-15]
MNFNIIQGGLGSGKTTFLVNVLSERAVSTSKILVVTQSNLHCDILKKKLKDKFEAIHTLAADKPCSLVEEITIVSRGSKYDIIVVDLPNITAIDLMDLYSYIGTKDLDAFVTDTAADQPLVLKNYKSGRTWRIPKCLTPSII